MGDDWWYELKVAATVLLLFGVAIGAGVVLGLRWIRGG
jgi:hypothetical protein